MTSPFFPPTPNSLDLFRSLDRLVRTEADAAACEPSVSQWVTACRAYEARREAERAEKEAQRDRFVAMFRSASTEDIEALARSDPFGDFMDMGVFRPLRTPIHEALDLVRAERRESSKVPS